jgi:hypothetical protein
MHNLADSNKFNQQSSLPWTQLRSYIIMAMFTPPVHECSSYNAKVHPHLPKLTSLLSRLSQRSSIQPIVVIIHSTSQPEDRSSWPHDWISWDTFVEEGKINKLGRTKDGEIEWKRQSFNWPLWILFSSGTTGTHFRLFYGHLLSTNDCVILKADRSELMSMQFVSVFMGMQCQTNCSPGWWNATASKEGTHDLR